MISGTAIISPLTQKLTMHDKRIETQLGLEKFTVLGDGLAASGFCIDRGLLELTRVGGNDSLSDEDKQSQQAKRGALDDGRHCCYGGAYPSPACRYFSVPGLDMNHEGSCRV